MHQGKARLGRGTGIYVAFALLLFLVSLVNLASTPPLWWDEGWTLSVARNWIERGHYGRFLAGAPEPPGLEAAFPVTALIGLSFRVFGIGIWQGRLIGILCMIGALGTMFFLARRLYGQKVAIASIAVLLFMSPHFFTHPLYIGRQALAEMPMLFFLLSGYALLLLALEKSGWFLAAAVVLWAVSLMSKAQVVPFWIVSMVLPLAVALLRRRWKTAIFFGSALFGSFISIRLFLLGQQLVLQGQTLPSAPLQGMYEITALVSEGFNRLFAVEMTLKFGLPTLLGLCYGAVSIASRFRRGGTSDRDLLGLSVLGLAGGWFAWYVLLSVGWPRYLFPPMFIGSLFVALMFYDLTAHFDLKALRALWTDLVRNRRIQRQGAALLLVFILILFNLPPTLANLQRLFTAPGEVPALEAARYLNTQTAIGALIETYDSEMHFLLNRRVHFPPDQIHVELNRRLFLDQSVPIPYDPLAANPDYLVIGAHSRMWKLYEPVVASGSFRLLRRFDFYEVYERVRP